MVRQHASFPIGFMVAVTALCLANPGTAQRQWIEYAPSASGYRIEFPGTPSTGTDSMSMSPDGPPVMAFRAYMADDEALFIAKHATFPTVWNDPGTEIDQVRDRIITAMGEKLVSWRRADIPGAVARRYAIQTSSRDILVGLLVVSGKRQYSHTCTIFRGSEESSGCKRFLDSFAIVP